MSVLLHDLVLAARNFRKYPGVSGLAALTLAIAIGGATSVFALVNAALWRPLPYDTPERLVAVFRHDVDRRETRNPTTPADFHDWREGSRSLQSLTAAHPFGPVLTSDGPAIRVAGLKASGSLFALLGAEPFLGRVLTEKDAEADTRTVVLSYDLWQRVLGGEESWIGRGIRLDGEDYRVVGVMPPSFFFPPFWATEAEFWVPLRFSAAERENRGAQYLRVFGRLAPGSALGEARAELDLLAERQREQYPDTNATAGINVEPLREPAVGGRRTAYAMLLGAVGLVLLVACANTANLLLARALGREREMAVRLALGARRSHLVRQMFAESFLLASIATGIGLLLSGALFRASWLFAAALPFPAEARLDVNVLGFALGLTLITTFLFGMTPAMRASRSRFDAKLRSSLSRQNASLSSGLVVGEVALSLALVVSALALMQSFFHLSRFDPGFQRERILTLDVSLTGTAHTEPGRQRVLFEAIAERVGSVPAVEAASFVNHLPIGGDLWRAPFHVDELDEESPPVAAVRTVGPTYFDTLGIVISAGRSFDGRDREDTEPVVIVNETLAERYFSGASPVGRAIGLRGGDVRATVIGVARDVRQWSLTDSVRPEIYFPYRQNPSSSWLRATLVVRSALAPEGLEASVRAAVSEIDPVLPVTAARTMEEVLSGSLTEPRLQSVLMAVFAALALALSIAGIYGIIAFGVKSRHREIGLRMALGASPSSVRRLMMRSGLALTGAGIFLGTLLALGLARVLAGRVPGTAELDLGTLAASAVLVLMAGTAASFVPARQASMLSPLDALHED